MENFKKSEMLQKYSANSLEKIKEKGADISRDMSNISLAQDDKTQELLKQTIKDINITPKKGLLGKLRNKAEGKFIDISNTNRLIQMFESEVAKNVSTSKVTLEEIKKGIARSKEYILFLDKAINDANEDIKKFESYIVENKLENDFEASQFLSAMNEAVIGLRQDKASFENALMQYQVQYGMQYKIIIAATNTRTSVTNKLREAVSQANILAKQKEVIKSNAEIQDMMRDIETNTSQGLSQMVNNNAEINQHANNQEHYRNLFNTNIQTIKTAKELDKEMDKSRNLLIESLNEDEKAFEEIYGQIDSDKKELEKGNVEKLAENYLNVEEEGGNV